MHYELFGSFLIFMFLALFGKLKTRSIFYIAFGLIFFKTYYLAFIAGMTMADLFLNYPSLKDAVSKRWTLAILAVGLVLGGWPTDQTVYPGIFQHLGPPGFSVIDTYVLAHILGAIMVMFAVLKLAALARFLEKRPVQYLGKISFSLYLLHFLILSSLGAYIFSHLMPRYGSGLALVATMVPSLA